MYWKMLGVTQSDYEALVNAEPQVLTGDSDGVALFFPNWKQTSQWSRQQEVYRGGCQEGP